MSFDSKDFRFPEGKTFALTVLDDTDQSTVTNVRPVYDHLTRLGMRTTKTVWPLAHPGESAFSASETLEDPDYLAFVRDLKSRGFEITWHGATMESSTRQQTILGIDRLRELVGATPEVHANHSYNRENLYWGRDRVDIGVLRLLYRGDMPEDHYEGHRPESPYWWGDLAQQHVRYGRNLAFNVLNLARVNPSMPYADPRRPLVRKWFSASDAPDVVAFNRLIRSDAQEKLSREGGFSVIATHFGKGFARDGTLDPETHRLLDELVDRGGWFPTVSELLSHLESLRPTELLPRSEWRTMQWRWALDRVAGKLRGR